MGNYHCLKLFQSLKQVGRALRAVLDAMASSRLRELPLGMLQSTDGCLHGVFLNSMNGYLKTSAVSIQYLLVQLRLGWM